MDTSDDEFRYKRFGRLDMGRLCDNLCRSVVSLLPGLSMPVRWVMPKTQEEFISKFGSGPKWAETANYSLYIQDGIYVFRIWTRTNADFAWIDLDDRLATALSQHVDISLIQPGIIKKCKPMTRRFAAKSMDDIALLVTYTRLLY